MSYWRALCLGLIICKMGTMIGGVDRKWCQVLGNVPSYIQFQKVAAVMNGAVYHTIKCFPF